METYNFQRIDREKLKDLVLLYRDAFGRTVTVGFLNKKFNTSFIGVSFIGFIAYTSTNKPVGFYGVYPCFVEYKRKKYIAAQSGDTMTHSEHRGKGLFTELAKKTYELCKEEGINFVFGFPNKNSYPGFIRKLTWQHHENMLAYTIRIKGITWLRLKKTFKLEDNIFHNRCQSILSALPKGNVFQNSVIKEETAGIFYDKYFMDYKRYGGNSIVQIANINVWLKYSEMYLLIGDIEKCDEVTFNQILHQLKKLGRRMGIPYLRFQCSPNAYWEKKWKKFGVKQEIEYPIGFVDFTNVFDLRKLKFTASDNDTF